MPSLLRAPRSPGGTAFARGSPGERQDLVYRSTAACGSRHLGECDRLRHRYRIIEDSDTRLEPGIWTEDRRSDDGGFPEDDVSTDYQTASAAEAEATTASAGLEVR